MYPPFFFHHLTSCISPPPSPCARPSRLHAALQDRSYFEALDAADEFAKNRAAFVMPKASPKSGRAEAIYLCGNSLGAMPVKTREYVCAELDKWGEFGVDGHFEEPIPWVSVDESVRDGSARLVGALPSEVCVMNSLTVNLHLMMAAFYKPDKASGKVKVLVEGKAFPSDMHMLQSQVRFHGLDPADAIVTLDPRPGEVTLRTEDIIATIEAKKGELALVLMSGVQYYTGQFFDIKAITSAARAAGLPCGWDLAHAVGNVPLNLHDDGPDFACWCTYKYLNSGPGNIAGCFVHERHGSYKSLAEFNRFAGWWGHRKSDRFEMDHAFIPSEGAQGFMCSNPPVLCCAALRASLDLFDGAGGVPMLRAKSEQLTGLLERLLDDLDQDPRLKGQVMRTRAWCFTTARLFFFS